MKISFSTLATPDWSWQQLLEQGPAYGYQGVEIRLLQGETDLLAREEFQPNQRAQRVRELANANFCVCGLGSSVRFDYAESSERQRQIDIGKAYIDLAKDLGAEFIRIFGDKFPPESNEEDRKAIMANVAEGLTVLGHYGEERGIHVLIETHGDFSDSQITQAAMEQVESSYAGVLWDTHHPWRFCGERVAETFARLKPWVRHTHWKDSVIRPQPVKQETTDEAAAAHALMSGHQDADYVLFGGGEFPAAETMQLLQWSDYNGWYSLEWEKAWHPEIEEPEIALPLFPGKIRQLAAHCRTV